jgi:AAA domain
MNELVPLDQLERASSRIQLIPFDKITLGSERRYLVKGLIPYPGLTVIWGPPKSVKSLWTQDVTTRVALGWDYRGRRVHQGPVVYCCFEGQAGIKGRVEAFRQKFLAEQTGDVPFFLQPVTLDLVKDHVELINAIRATLGSINPVAVVLDTLNRSLAGSESSDTDMSSYVRAADTIRDAFDCSVLIVHHCGINDSRPRGHTSLTGAADAQLAVRRDGNNVFVTVEFMKDGTEGETVASRLEILEIGMDEDGEAITSCVVVESDAKRAGTSKRGRKLSRSAQIALKAIGSALEAHGEMAPASNYIPPNIRIVSLERWRDFAYAQGISGSESPDARRVAFKRGAEALFAEGVVGTWQEKCWLV